MSERFDDISRVLASEIPRRDAVRLAALVAFGRMVPPELLRGRAGATRAFAGRLACQQNLCNQGGAAACPSAVNPQCLCGNQNQCGVIAAGGTAPGIACCCPTGSVICPDSTSTCCTTAAQCCSSQGQPSCCDAGETCYFGNLCCGAGTVGQAFLGKPA